MHAAIAVLVLTSASCATTAVSSPASVQQVLDRRVYEVRQGNGVIRYDVRELRIVGPDGRGGTQQRDLLIAYEPHTKLAWWASNDIAEFPAGYRHGFPARLMGSTTSTIGTSAKAMVVFVVWDVFPTIVAFESRARFRSAEDAERRVVANLGKHPPAGNVEIREHRIELGKRVPPLFHIPPGGGHIPRPLTLTGVIRLDHGWIVTLQGARGDLADVTIDDEFQLLDVRTYR